MKTPRVEDLLSDALSWSPEERARRLNEACGGDAKLRAEVESLVEAHERAGVFMSEPSLESPVSAPAGEGPGTVVGRYRLLQLIGEGGFGAVYMAEQREPVQRRVAVKVVKLGMDTKKVIARFEAERQALAMMDHPNIAHVLDAGATDTGRPYFVMELVRGDPITEYCDRENMSIRARLELFQQVCRAVQHAHQKGVIHRDLKPSNILVAEIDGRPLPRIIDFGIARATAGHARLTDKTLFTDFRQFIGTPEYMSPEQAGMGVVDIDTRSDIYSLGVLLYELLTGGPPFDPKRLRSATWEEMRRIIREDEPQRPSTRLYAHQDTREVAARRRTGPAQLIGLVRGDLDWIVMKCLEKDRRRRYETANGLAMDIGRYLAAEPVVAAPPSPIYRLRKFVARHRGAVVAAVAVALVLMLGTISTSAGLAWALHEAERAQRAEGQTRRRAAELEQEIAFKEAQFANLDAALQFASVRNRGQAAAYLRNALEGRREALGDADVLTLDTMMNLGVVLLKLDELDEAERLLQEALDGFRRLRGEDDPRTILCMSWLGAARENLGRLEEAELLCGEAAEHARRLLRVRPELVEALTIVFSHHASTLMLMNRFEEAEAVYLERFALRESGGGRSAQLAAWQLARLYERWHEAEPDAGHDAEAMKWRRRIDDFSDDEGEGSVPEEPHDE
jgi:tetratricopeptide (TPR) repeat protein